MDNGLKFQIVEIADLPLDLAVYGFDYFLNLRQPRAWAAILPPYAARWDLGRVRSSRRPVTLQSTATPERRRVGSDHLFFAGNTAVVEQIFFIVASPRHLVSLRASKRTAWDNGVKSRPTISLEVRLASRAKRLPHLTCSGAGKITQWWTGIHAVQCRARDR